MRKSASSVLPPAAERATFKVEPEVFVVLTSPRPAQINILGEVVRPGFYSFVSGSPLNVALSAAGGSTEDADLRTVIVCWGKVV